MYLFFIKNNERRNDFLNNDLIIKCRISNDLGMALKRIIEKKQTTQQELLENLIKHYILNNINIVLEAEKN